MPLPKVPVKVTTQPDLISPVTVSAQPDTVSLAAQLLGQELTPEETAALTPGIDRAPSGVDEAAAFLGSELRVDPNIHVSDFPALQKTLTAGEEATNFTKQVFKGALGTVLDVASRGQYGSAKFADSFVGTAKKSFIDAARDAASEALHPKDRMSFADVIRKNNPKMAEDSPVATEIVGFLGDIALDPLTYLTLGTTRGIKILGEGAKEVTLSKKGEDALKGLINAANSANQGTSYKTIRESVDKQMVNLMQADPSLVDKGYVRFGGAPVLPKKVQDGVRDLFNYSTKLLGDSVESAVQKTVKALPPGPASVVAGIYNAPGIAYTVFNRNAGLPDNYVLRRTKLEGAKEAAKKDVEATYMKLFENHDAASRQKITEVGQSVDELTGQLIKAYGRQLTPAEAARVRHQIIQNHNLNPDEVATYSRLLQDFEDIKQVEVQAGLLAGTRTNYFPRIYQDVEKPQLFNYRNRTTTPQINTQLNSGKRRTYETVSEAVNAGLIPEMDAMVIGAYRVLESKRAMANLDFKNDVMGMFGVHSLDELPRRIQDDIRFIGDSIYPPGLKEEARAALAGFDYLQNGFKKMATVMKPAFAVKQGVSNTLQSFGVQGVRAFKVLDPRSWTDAAALIRAHDGNLSPQQLSQIVLKSPLGDVYDGNDLLKIFRENNVLRGTQIGDVTFTRNMKGELDRAIASKKVLGQQGTEMVDMFLKAANWTHWPGMVEDMSRATMVMNGLRIGHSPATAAALADKALFNYAEGLSAFEKQLMRRIVPFYSYQRFAIPLFMDVAGHTPGRIANTGKVGNALFQSATHLMRGMAKVNNGDTLTDSERRVGVADYILEQPHTFQRFDEKMQAVFNTFNNYTFLDVVGTVELDKNGDVDISRTMRKSALAQLTPMLKIPLEMALEKKMFTDQAIADANKLGDLRAIGDFLPENVKNAIGWEVGKTTGGKPTVYINPTLAYLASSTFPILNEVFRQASPELSPTEKAMSLLFGVGTIKTDLKKNFQQRVLGQKAEIKEQKTLVRKLARQERELSFMKAMQDYKALAERIKSENQGLGNIRGVGDESLMQQLQEEAGTPQQ